MAKYESSQSNRFASRPTFSGECASELEMSVKRSSCDTRQFIAGSEESPVSAANTCGARSAKHSSSESNPDCAPSAEYQGVHMCAGTKYASGEELQDDFEQVPRIETEDGLPSDSKLPTRASRSLMRPALAKSGA